VSRAGPNNTSASRRGACGPVRPWAAGAVGTVFGQPPVSHKQRTHCAGRWPGYSADGGGRTARAGDKWRLLAELIRCGACFRRKNGNGVAGFRGIAVRRKTATSSQQLTAKMLNRYSAARQVSRCSRLPVLAIRRWTYFPGPKIAGWSDWASQVFLHGNGREQAQQKRRSIEAFR
jgi:hypothetical protein